MNKQLGTASGAVIVGGVIVSVLLYKTENIYSDDRVRNITGFDIQVAFFPGWWTIGLVLYTLPGIFGLYASFVQSRWEYATTCLNASTSVHKMVPFITHYYAFFCFVVFANKMISKYCIDANSTCACRFDTTSSSDDYKSTVFQTCADLENYVNETYDKVNMALLFTFLVMTCLAEITEGALACYYTCCSRPTDRRVIMPFRQQILRPVPYMMPPAYGQAGSDVVFQATIKRQLTFTVHDRPVTDNRIDG